MVKTPQTLLRKFNRKPNQISLKIIPKSFQIFPKPFQNPPQIHPGPPPNPLLEGSSEGVAKCPRNSSILVFIWAPPGLYFGSIFHKKTFQKLVFFWYISCIGFGIDLGAQMPPKTFKKWFKIKVKKRWKNEWFLGGDFFALFKSRGLPLKQETCSRTPHKTRETNKTDHTHAPQRQHARVPSARSGFLKASGCTLGAILMDLWSLFWYFSRRMEKRCIPWKCCK